MKHYGLIGERLVHSYSQTLHGLLADYDYRLMPMLSEALDGLMTARDFDGLNVTIPYKKAVMPYCSQLSETARRIGSVNTIVRRGDGSLYGDNTDAYGFLVLAQSAGIDFSGRKTLVLGSGGTSLTACDVICQQGGEAVVISRQGENTYDDLEKHSDAAFLVNTTPVGMYPDTDASPVELSRLPNLKGVLDVIYNPLRSRLLQQAAVLGLLNGGGLKMLVYQAVRACELFTGESVPKERAVQAEAALRRSAMNLVLVGMPGCGKTTVGKELRRLSNMPLVDFDEEIAKAAGMTIPEIFAREGEAGFRQRESELITRFGREKGKILVTGGGAIKQALNREHLRLNGFVAFITRGLDELPTAGRPLSQNRANLEKLWRERQPLYANCADITVSNETAPAACAGEIWEAMNEALRAERA